MSRAGRATLPRRAAIGRLVLRRLAMAVPVLLVVACGVFLLGAASPFDPIHQYYGVEVFSAGEEQLEQTRDRLGIDDPVHVQFGQWVGGLVTGDLGTSRVYHQPVADVLAERLPWTLLLAGTGLVVAALLALVLGIVTAWRQGGWLDRTVTAIGQGMEGLPSFVLAFAAILVFSVLLGWLPVAGVTDGNAEAGAGQVAQHLVLPALVLGVSQSPWLVLHLRQSMLTSLADDHVIGARARGLPEPLVVTGHALPTALLPFLNVLGTRVPELVTGAVLVETVFSWPGVAAAMVDAGLAVDYPLLAVLALAATVAVLLGSLLADIATALADPRVRADG
ncbi:ABC transporter permease [Saccharomonospora sp. CUA-673]|uniref:ABC transporter permease n=1 Tax=Saccharomonospora sp. CUA-673 TaxID=1904969 RepID=UPI00095F3CD3|nr:ABC transporter permease [Saccharomonospora sp. CUA-673]OLT46618.1 ABC transporter permease [Saccharomonospora sp. CUA-673]